MVAVIILQLSRFCAGLGYYSGKRKQGELRFLTVTIYIIIQISKYPTGF